MRSVLSSAARIENEPRLDTAFESALLLGCYFRSYGKAERIYECKEPFVLLGNEIIRQPGNGN